LQTSDRLTITVRTPSNYDPTRAYPLLVVYPPARFDRRQSEIFYDLTTETTRRGFIVADSDHIVLSSTAVSQQAKVAATVASFFYVAAKNFKFSQTCGHLFQAGRPMRVYAVPAVIRLRLVITAITTPLVAKVRAGHPISDSSFADYVSSRADGPSQYRKRSISLILKGRYSAVLFWGPYASQQPFLGSDEFRNNY
jgi:hypothetical protein